MYLQGLEIWKVIFQQGAWTRDIDEGFLKGINGR